MLDQYRRVLELLGKTPDDPCSRQFTKDLGQTPAFEHGYYVFGESGITLICVARTFVMVTFDIAKSVEGEKIYSGDLPAGIAADDSREEVRRKLAATAGFSWIRSDDNSSVEVADDWWDFAPFKLKFSFSQGTDKLNSLLVHCDEEQLSRLGVSGIRQTTQRPRRTSSHRQHRGPDNHPQS